MKDLDSPLAGLALAFAFGTALVACAQTPSAPATAAATLDCAALAGEIRAATEARGAAEEQQQDAWKAIVPFAVAARYARGKAAAQESQQQLAELQRQAVARGCHEPVAVDARGGAHAGSVR